MSKKYTDTELKIRRAEKNDMFAVAEMIQELADFEKMSDGPKICVKDLQRDGFETQPPAFRCLVAVLSKEETDFIVGYALYFPTYSTWEGQSMMLEDLYVRKRERRRGVGHKLFNAVAKEAIALGSSRLDFHVLEWNDARAFYEGKGAVNLTNSEKWCYYRLTGEPLKVSAELGEMK
ncbi:thialysine N-epsilon-acetyltransferase-like [Vanessa tameamea]|uniref:Thialysine N-epsilon-acetyltransferase-like n=1 Tax=Vanessa tameamea TaxID=334116 RepID=A0A8B8HIS9_VANTA